MSKLFLSACAAAILCGSLAAFAQPETPAPDAATTTTTQTTQSPNGDNQTMVTKSDDQGNFSQYKKTVTSSHHYQAATWTPPPDFTYHRFAVGDRVPQDLLADPYFLADYANFKLTTPPDGLVWVRVKGDALLVDRSSGEVIQSDYGVFR